MQEGLSVLFLEYARAGTNPNRGQGVHFRVLRVRTAVGLACIVENMLRPQVEFTSPSLFVTWSDSRKPASRLPQSGTCCAPWLLSLASLTLGSRVR